MAEPRLESILVWGAGAIGGTVAAHLTEVGADVTAVTTNPRIHDAVAAHGFRVTGETDERAVPGKIALGVPDQTFDLILLATQPPQVEAAAASALPALAADGHMVCFQNGLCEVRIARLVGERRVIGGIVAWGASMPEPGLYDKTSAGGFVLGRLDGEIDDFIEAGIRWRRGADHAAAAG